MEKKNQPTPRAEKHIKERSKVGGCQKSAKTGRKKKKRREQKKKRHLSEGEEKRLMKKKRLDRDSNL